MIDPVVIERVARQVLESHGFNEAYIARAISDDWPHWKATKADVELTLSASPLEQMAEALEIVANSEVDVSDTAIIVGNGASTVIRQLRAALSSYSGTKNNEG